MSFFELKLRNKKLSEEEILSDIQRVADKLSQKTVSINDYNIHGKYDVRSIQRRFETWNQVLQKAGFEIGLVMNISDEELFNNLETLWTKLGRQPTQRELIPPESKYSIYPYKRRFGSWNHSLEAFVKYVGEEGDEVLDTTEKIGPPLSNTKEFVHKTSRNISDRLRFRILMRDGFTCAKCGRSPMKERGVELHVDHILPWSKGGETVPENLETKCEKCNLGKGNAFNV